MKTKYKIVFAVLIAALVAFTWALFSAESSTGVMVPKGTIALKQRDLIITSSWLMLIVVIPTLILTYVIAWKYRKGNHKAKYNPEWDYDLTAEAIWWGVPFVIIAVLSVLVWKSSYDLDPFKPLESSKKPLTVQAVALQWKWLFIYPEQKIAVVNYMQLPKDVPLVFDITADAPMNSFWIPQLGGQIYAMPGMKSKLHLIATEEGSFRGSSANLSGRGFSGMNFMTEVVVEDAFDHWVQSAQQSSHALTMAVYDQLAEPSENDPVVVYTLQDPDLYEKIVMKYMAMDGK